MNNNIDWIIHLVANGACDECGKEEKGFLPYTCNAHTHGMEKYGHPDFQVVRSLPPVKSEGSSTHWGLGFRKENAFKPVGMYPASMPTAISVWMNFGKRDAMCCVQSYRIGRIVFRKTHSAKNHIDCRAWIQRICMREKVHCRENCHLPDCDRAR